MAVDESEYYFFEHIKLLFMHTNYFSLLAFLCLFGSPILTSGQLVPLVKDSQHIRYYDYITGQEQFGNSGYFTYDTDGLPLSDLFVSHFGGSNTYYQYNYTYNANQQLEKSISYKSSVSATGPWENWLNEEYFYDVQGRNNYYITQFGNASGGWDNYFKENLWFDDVTPADSSLYEVWLGGVWENNHRNFNYYYPNGAPKKQHQDNWDTVQDVWENEQDFAYTYYPDGKTRTLIETSYSNDNPSIIRKDSFLYLVDGKIDTVHTTTTVSNNVYRLITKYRYDPAGNLIFKDVIIRSGNVWVPSSSETFLPPDSPYSDAFAYENQASYNAATDEYDVLWEIFRQYEALDNGRVLAIEKRTQRNNGTLTLQVLDSSWHHTTLNVPTKTPPVAVADCVFANPFSQGNGIRCNAPDPNATLMLRLIDALGRTIAQTQIQPGATWHPAASIPTGSYTLSVWQQGKYLGYRKISVR
jgi:hypothetical protein